MKRLLFLAALLCPALAGASFPRQIGYQGRLLKADGSPESGVVAITFSLFEAPSGGSSVWSEAQQLGINDGFYATALGEKTAIPENLLDGRSLYLEVSVGGEALVPRQALGSAPFALRAAVASSVEGGTVDAESVQVAGQTVIDSSGKLAGSAAYAAGSGLSLQGNTFSMTTGCAAGQILKWDGSAWACSGDAGGLTSVAVGAPLAGAGTGAEPLTLARASASADGYLAAGDFAAFAGKAEKGHAHAVADVTGLQAGLDAKAAADHGHAVAGVSGLQSALDAKAAADHGHAVAGVTGLQAALDAKAAADHGHAIAGVTGLQAALDSKLASEADPKVGPVSEGKLCTGSGGKVVCTGEAPVSGKVLQVVSTVDTGHYVANTTSFAEVSGNWRLSITPVSPTSKLILTASFVTNTYGTIYYLRHYRFFDLTSNAPVGIGGAAGSRNQATMAIRGSAYDANDATPVHLAAVASSGSTNARTYTVQWRVEYGAQTYFSHSQGDSSNFGWSTPFVFTIYEVAN